MTDTGTVAPDRRARVLAVASGKGGVGKTSIAVNLAVALSRAGRRAMLVDCDVGLADAAIMLGLNATTTMEDVATGRVPLEAAIAPAEAGLLLVPGASGAVDSGALAEPHRRQLAECFRPQADLLDYLIVDPPAGIQPQTMELIAMSDRVLLVLTGEPTSFMDGYATLKLLALEHGCTTISVIVNMADSEASARELFGRFDDVASRFLPSELHYLGAMPRDEHVRMAIMHKRPCVTLYPEARASAALVRLAQAVDGMDVARGAGGAHFFGLERSHGVD